MGQNEGGINSCFSCSVYRQAAVLPGQGGAGRAEDRAKVARGEACAWAEMVFTERHIPGGATLRTPDPTGASSFL